MPETTLKNGGGGEEGVEAEYAQRGTAVGAESTEMEGGNGRTLLRSGARSELPRRGGRDK